LLGSIARDFKEINYIPYIFFDVEKKIERRDKKLRKRPELAMDIKSRDFRFHFLFYKYGSSSFARNELFSFEKEI